MKEQAYCECVFLSNYCIKQLYSLNLVKQDHLGTMPEPLVMYGVYEALRVVKQPLMLTIGTSEDCRTGDVGRYVLLTFPLLLSFQSQQHLCDFESRKLTGMALRQTFACAQAKNRSRTRS